MDTNNSENIKNIDGGEKKQGLTFMLLGLCYTVACVYLPLAVSVNMGEWLTLAVALGICALGGFALTRMAGSFKPIAGFVIIISIFVVLGGAVLPMALLVAFASAACAYAWLLLNRPSLPVWVLPVLPAAIGIALTRDASGALFALATLPCSHALAFSIKNKLQRVSAICRISAAMCAFIAVAFIFTVYSFTGEISFSAARELIDVAKVELTLMLDGAVGEMSEFLGVDTASLDVAELAVGAAFNLLPAIVITVANVAAYLIHSLFMSVYFTTDEQRKQALPMLSFEMSLTSSIVYVASLAISLLLVSESLALWGTAAENIALVLAPGLILTALAGIRALSMRKGPSCLGTLLYLGVIFMIASLSGIVIMLVALVGAVLNIVAHIAKRKSQSN